MKTAVLTALMTAGIATISLAQQTPMSAVAQITSAVSPLPQEFREGATVLGYVAGAKGLTQLRAGSGAFTCLADDPSDTRFHVACYHNTLEPFMERGRALRASGVTAPAAVDSVRFAEIKSGKLELPRNPAALYSITLRSEQMGELNTTTGAVPASVKPLYVVYIPYSTSESTGLPKAAAPGMPWIMFPGSPKAHIMFVPTM